MEGSKGLKSLEGYGRSGPLSNNLYFGTSFKMLLDNPNEGFERFECLKSLVYFGPLSNYLQLGNLSRILSFRTPIQLQIISYFVENILGFFSREF